MGHTVLVQHISGNGRAGVLCKTTSKQSYTTTTGQTDPSSRREDNIHGWDTVKEILVSKGFNQNVISTIFASWRKGTKLNYERHLKKWILFCNNHSVDFVNPPITIALNFLQMLFDEGKSYSDINTACSALSVIVQNEGSTFGNLPIVTRFMKGIFELRPSFPKYTFIWDIQKVFDYFRDYYPEIIKHLLDCLLYTSPSPRDS